MNESLQTGVTPVLPSSTTRVVGIFGHPISHTYSPLIHNSAFCELGLDFLYLPFDVHPQNLKSALRGLTALGIVGVNITIPHKENVIPLLDEVVSEARAIGAVNTIVNDGEKLRGYNTDIIGVAETLRPYAAEIEGREVAIIGSGGGARAVVYVLIHQFKPRYIHIVHTDIEYAIALRKFLLENFGFKNISAVDLYMPATIAKLKSSTLIVNATPVGMYPKTDESLVETPEAFHSQQIVFDLIYNPIKTKFLRFAESQGARIIGGLDMLLHQAAKSFELWISKPMPIEKIRTILFDTIAKME
jgi:shikimate dehydrogenase